MGFFRRWREKKANKKINKLKNQENNLQGNDDILNKSETLTLRTNFDENNLLIAYNEDEDLKIDTDTSLEIKEDLDLEELSSQQQEPVIETTKEFEKKTKQMIKNTTKDQKDIMKTTKTISIDTSDKKGRNIYYVSARKDKAGKKLGWEVKKENASKITKLCETKEQAIEYVKEKAGNQGSTCIIRKVDGSIDKTLKFDVPSSK